MTILLSYTFISLEMTEQLKITCGKTTGVGKIHTTLEGNVYVDRVISCQVYPTLCNTT